MRPPITVVMPRKSASAKALAKPPPPKPKPVHERGLMWQAEKLTGNRAQKGSLPGGAPKWTCVLPAHENHTHGSKMTQKRFRG